MAAWLPKLKHGSYKSKMYSTEPLFCTNLCQAMDIYIWSQPIGQKSDGVNYLKFLTALKARIGSEKSVLNAAPASYWCLKSFPIGRIASIVDYIVYMTYDFHGQ